MATVRTSHRVLALLAAVALWAAPAAAQDLARGEVLYDLCTQCHGAQGAGNSEYLAPSIAGLPEWYVTAQLAKFRAGIRGGHPEDIGGMRMMPMAIHLGDVESDAAVAAYIASLPPAMPEPELEGGDPERGKSLYTVCGSCHGLDAAGMQPLNSPPLKLSSDWYLLTQLKHFKQGVRGRNPKDTTGMLMTPMAMSLVDEQAMKDVVAYIMSLR